MPPESLIQRIVQDFEQSIPPPEDLFIPSVAVIVNAFSGLHSEISTLKTLPDQLLGLLRIGEIISQ